MLLVELEHLLLQPRRIVLVACSWISFISGWIACIWMLARIAFWLSGQSSSRTRIAEEDQNQAVGQAQVVVHPDQQPAHRHRDGRMTVRKPGQP